MRVKDRYIPEDDPRRSALSGVVKEAYRIQSHDQYGAPNFDEPDPIWTCPYCGRSMPSGLQPEAWTCCFEVGHAMLIDGNTGERIE